MKQQQQHKRLQRPKFEQSSNYTVRSFVVACAPKEWEWDNEKWGLPEPVWTPTTTGVHLYSNYATLSSSYDCAQTKQQQQQQQQRKRDQSREKNETKHQPHRNQSKKNTTKHPIALTWNLIHSQRCTATGDKDDDDDDDNEDDDGGNDDEEELELEE